MMPRDINNPSHSRWSGRTGRLINAACFLILLVVIATVIYGLLLRALYEKSYYGAAGLAILGALIMLIGLAQQTIAARDAATWREMAEWQLEAARAKTSLLVDPENPQETVDPHSALYYEHLVEALINDIRAVEAQEPRHGR